MKTIHEYSEKFRVKCTVCGGHGTRPRLSFSAPLTPTTGLCNGCHGRGWNLPDNETLIERVIELEKKLEEAQVWCSMPDATPYLTSEAKAFEVADPLTADEVGAMWDRMLARIKELIAPLTEEECRVHGERGSVDGAPYIFSAGDFEQIMWIRDLPPTTAERMLAQFLDQFPGVGECAGIFERFRLLEKTPKRAG